MEITDVLLPGNVMMPRIGLGTFPMKGKELEVALEAALDAGYRLIDTAYNYFHQEVIGKVIKSRIDSGQLKREDLFITTKLPGAFMESAETVHRNIQLCLDQLQVDYVDLFLIHGPCGFEYEADDVRFPKDENGKMRFRNYDLVQTWKGMEALVDAGLARAIGVSNFNIQQLQRISKEARIPIANNQVECHAYLQQKKLREYCQTQGIVVTAYGPMGAPGRDKGHKKVIEDAEVLKIATKYERTPAQILLNFLLNQNVAIIPKSSNKDRVSENLKAISFNLKDEDIQKLRDIDCGLRYYDLKKIFAGHPEYPFIEDE